jgi:hypothetical protein
VTLHKPDTDNKSIRRQQKRKSSVSHCVHCLYSWLSWPNSAPVVRITKDTHTHSRWAMSSPSEWQKVLLCWVHLAVVFHPQLNHKFPTTREHYAIKTKDEQLYPNEFMFLTYRWASILMRTQQWRQQIQWSLSCHHDLTNKQAKWQEWVNQ